MRSALVVTGMLLVLGGCPSVPCETESVSFEMPESDDDLVLRIVACPVSDSSWMGVDLKLQASRTPSTPLMVLVDGVPIRPVAPMAWSTGDFHRVPVEDADCDPGKVIRLKRVDAEPRLVFEGRLEVETSASVWDRKTCSLELVVESSTPER